MRIWNAEPKAMCSSTCNLLDTRSARVFFCLCMQSMFGAEWGLNDSDESLFNLGAREKMKANGSRCPSPAPAPRLLTQNKTIRSVPI